MAPRAKPPSATTRRAAREAVEAARTKGRPDRRRSDPLTGELHKREVLPLLVLHFIASGPSYGNQLMERIGDLTAGVLAVNPNTMYPLLRRLEADGLIKGEWEHPERRSRRFYSITRKGRAEYKRLLEDSRPFLDALTRSLGAIVEEIYRVMGTVRQETVVPLDPGDADALWCDTARWPTFVEGFARVVEAPADWPDLGSKLVWESIPEGRGRVTEKVTERVPGAVLATRVFESRLTGIQRISFEPDPEGTYVELGLEYTLTKQGPLVALEDVFFIRRALSDALYRTIRRFRIEAAEEVQR